MTDKERKTIEEFVKEMFHYEHDMSTTILARVMLLCELLIDKGILTENEVMTKLSVVNVAKMMENLGYGEGTWNVEEIKL